MADKTQGPVVYTALIMPLSSHASFPKPQPPGGGAPPPAGGQPPRPDNTLPGDLPRPEHPIWFPLPPGGYPDNTLPGDLPRPDHELPGDQPHPEHPIFLPPDGGNWLPIYIWGPNDPRPTPPIELPPDGTMPDDESAKVEWKAMWTPTTGWVSFAIVIPGSDTPVPTPSKQP